MSRYTLERFWVAVARFAIRRVRVNPHRKADGLPGVRDYDARCPTYLPGPREPHAECFGDGHYLCTECRWFKPEPTWQEGA